MFENQEESRRLRDPRVDTARSISVPEHCETYLLNLLAVLGLSVRHGCGLVAAALRGGC